MGRWMALSLWLVVAAMPVVATAGSPRPLTSAQLEKVTAGALQLNLNVNVQTAVPIAVAVAACSFCGDPHAAALAFAKNVNVPTLININVR
jgi:hypothetical protein